MSDLKLRSDPYGYEANWTIEQHRDELIERLGKAITRVNKLELESAADKQRIAELETRLAVEIEQGDKWQDRAERVESELAIARERHKQEEPVCESDFCHHSGLAHCNLGPDGRRGCCYCLCESYLPAPPESMRKEKQA